MNFDLQNHKKEITLKKIDVFVDIENLCRVWDMPHSLYFMDSIARMLPSALREKGYEVASLTAFASSRSCGRIVSSAVQSLWMEKLSSLGGKMARTSGIADQLLIASVEKKRRGGTLEQTVMFVTGDADFTPLVVSLREAGYFIVVSGPQVSHRLKKQADMHVQLQGFVWDNVPVDEHATSNAKPLSNPIPFPF